MDEDLATGWTKKFRALTIALIFSGALNIAFFASFIFSALEEKDPSFSFSPRKEKIKAQELGLAQLFASMKKLSFRELVSFLTNRDFVEDGYTKRDLALAALTSCYHFNLEKALSGAPSQSRILQLPEGEKIEIFPALSEDQFEAIIRYAYQEKWPLTSKGLFSFLQKIKPGKDESLDQTFLTTNEFHTLQILFQKTGAPQENSRLLKMISEGSWEMLERFSLEQAKALDLSKEKRTALLLDYLAMQSETAAELLVSTDFTFALKKLEDRSVISLLSLLNTKSQDSQRFCVELLRSSRSDAVWQAAATRLYSYAGEIVQGSIDPKEALARFSKTEPPKVAPSRPVEPQVLARTERSHLVKEGESLWKIARQYKVKLDDLVQLNGLEKDRLLPGMTLKIPQGTGSEPPR